MRLHEFTNQMKHSNTLKLKIILMSLGMWYLILERFNHRKSKESTKLLTLK